MSSVWAEVERRAGLPRVVSRPSLRRALSRAGIAEPAELSCVDLQRALPELHATLRVYHGDEEAAKRLDSLRAICTEGGANV